MDSSSAAAGRSAVTPGAASRAVGGPTVRTAAILALAVTVVLGSVSDALYAAAFRFRLDWLADPGRLVAAGPGSAELLKWAALTDLFSYYLPIAVVVTALFGPLQRCNPALALAATAAGFGYVVAGSCAAAALAVAGPSLMKAYAQPAADTGAIAIMFGTLTDVVFRAAWQLVDGVLLGFAWTATGWLLLRDLPRLGRLTIALGGFYWLATGLNILGFGTARDAALGAVFALWDVWSIWLAWLLARRVGALAPAEDAPQG